MRFRIWYNIKSFAYADINARTLEEAEKFAEHIDGDAFVEVGDSEWELDHEYNIQSNLPDVILEQIKQ